MAKKPTSLSALAELKPDPLFDAVLDSIRRGRNRDPETVIRPATSAERSQTNYDEGISTLAAIADAMSKQPIARLAGWIGKLTDEGIRGNMGQEDLVLPDGRVIPSENQQVAATVYHGSPHTFEKFDMGKIGTGEGAQSYGHGLYFAENPRVARSYREQLADSEVRIMGQTIPVPTWSADLSPQPWTIRALADARAIKPNATEAEIVEHVKQRILPDLNSSDRRVANAAQSKLDILDAAVERKLETSVPGGTYHVDLPDSAIDQMLDWDAPLSQQSEAVKRAIAGYVPQTNTTGQPWPEAWEMSGGELVERIRRGGSPEVFSYDLLKAGVPGIKYFDGSSRVVGQGTRNYVVFDDQLPTIMKVER